MVHCTMKNANSPMTHLAAALLGAAMATMLLTQEPLGLSLTPRMGISGFAPACPGMPPHAPACPGMPGHAQRCQAPPLPHALPKRDPSRALAPPQIIESTKPKPIVARAKTVAQLSSNKLEHKFRKP